MTASAGRFRLRLTNSEFYRGKLYVGSNIGLFAIDPDRSVTVLEWGTGVFSIVSGPWKDTADDALWIELQNENTMLRWDAAGWQRAPTPRSTRHIADTLQFPWGFSGQDGFHFVARGSSWRWSAADQRWQLEPGPSEEDLPEAKSVLAVAPFGGTVLYLVREGSRYWKATQHAVYEREGQQWKRRPIEGDVWFERQVITEAAVYFLLKDGRLLAVTLDSIDFVTTPSRCEAIARTSDGRLLASFLDKGIYARDGGEWTLRANDPYGSEEGEHSARLAEQDGVIAYVTSTEPHFSMGERIADSGTEAVWMGAGPQLERVELERK